MEKNIKEVCSIINTNVNSDEYVIDNLITSLKKATQDRVSELVFVIRTGSYYIAFTYMDGIEVKVFVAASIFMNTQSVERIVETADILHENEINRREALNVV